MNATNYKEKNADDLIILVDQDDREIGYAPKLQPHEEGRLHRAFSVFIVNSRGQMLIQKRAAHKYHSAGLWSNACCSHPRKGESLQEATHRRLAEEIGFDTDLRELFSFTYRIDFSDHLHEYEYDHVFVGKYDGEVAVNPDEASELRWVDPEKLKEEMTDHPETFSGWFLIAAPRVLNCLEQAKFQKEDAADSGLAGGRQELLASLKKYKPYNEQEERDLPLIIDWIETHEDAFLRSNTVAHITASAWVVNRERTKVLMVYHNIYNSWSWMGGHADGETNLLAVALKEVREESGVENVRPVSPEILSVESLTVDGHIKKGSYVSSHLHLNVTYLLEADEEDLLKVKPDENSGVAWFTPEEALEKSTEPWFVEHIYRKCIERAKRSP